MYALTIAVEATTGAGTGGDGDPARGRSRYQTELAQNVAALKKAGCGAGFDDAGGP